MQYPAEQDGQRDAPNVKIENNTIPLVDQQMWNIELVEWLRAVTEPYFDPDGKEISVKILVPMDEQMLKYDTYMHLRAKYDKPPKRKRIKHMLGALLTSFAILNPVYAWEMLHKEDAENG